MPLDESPTDYATAPPPTDATDGVSDADLAFHLLHRGMRQDSVRLAAAVASLPEAERASRGKVLARWYRGFCEELHDHHTIEDEIFGPALLDRVPEARALVDRIDTDHRHLSDLLERTTAALDRLADPSAPFRATQAEAVMVTDGLRALLDAHLAFEDADVVPYFSARFAPEEYDALHQQAQKRVKPRHLFFVIPWVMDNATEDERRKLFADAPFVMKMIWFASRARYRRTTAAAFGAGSGRGSGPR